MARSKLELFEDIICSFAKKALTIDDIAFKCNASCVLLQDKLEFLLKNDIVNIEISKDNKVFYALTRRGLAISKTLVITKRLQKLQTSQQTCEQAVHTGSSFREGDEERARASW